MKEEKEKTNKRREKKERNILKLKENGITLIALVITIIVLLILVGVTLSTLSGQDGILTKATTAADKTNKEAIKEKIQLEIFDCYDNNNDFSMDKLQGKLSKKYENVKYYANGSIILPIDKYFAMIKEENGNIVIEVEEKEEKFDLAEEKVIDVVLGNLEDFKNFKESVNNGEDYTGKIIKQTADIDMGGAQNESWTSIGTKAHPFNGTYDGGKHSIKNLYIRSEEQAETIGLFGYNTGTIKNVIIESGTIEANATNVGAICGWNKGGTIERCLNNATISGQSLAVGAICAVTEGGIIKQCCNSSDITITSSEKYACAAGICGCTSSTDSVYSIEECYNTGDITVVESNGHPNCSASGIMSLCYSGRVSSCYNTGTIKLRSECSTDVCPVSAGIVGQFNGAVSALTNCYNAGNIIIETENEKGEKNRIASIIGFFGEIVKTPVSNCFWATGTASKGIGQIVGEQTDTTEEKSVEELKKLTGDELGDAFTSDTIRN